MNLLPCFICPLALWPDVTHGSPRLSANNQQPIHRTWAVVWTDQAINKDSVILAVKPRCSLICFSCYLQGTYFYWLPPASSVMLSGDVEVWSGGTRWLYDSNQTESSFSSCLLQPCQPVPVSWDVQWSWRGLYNWCVLRTVEAWHCFV